MSKLINNLSEATSAGIQWAEDRKSAGTSWGRFLLDDVVPICETIDLAHEVCESASRRWKELS